MKYKMLLMAVVLSVGCVSVQADLVGGGEFSEPLFAGGLVSETIPGVGSWSYQVGGSNYISTTSCCRSTKFSTTKLTREKKNSLIINNKNTKQKPLKSLNS